MPLEARFLISLDSKGKQKQVCFIPTTVDIFFGIIGILQLTFDGETKYIFFFSNHLRFYIRTFIFLLEIGHFGCKLDLSRITFGKL